MSERRIIGPLSSVKKAQIHYFNFRKWQNPRQANAAGFSDGLNDAYASAPSNPCFNARARLESEHQLVSPALRVRQDR